MTNMDNLTEGTQHVRTLVCATPSGSPLPPIKGKKAEKAVDKAARKGTPAQRREKGGLPPIKARKLPVPPPKSTRSVTAPKPKADVAIPEFLDRKKNGVKPLTSFVPTGAAPTPMPVVNAVELVGTPAQKLAAEIVERKKVKAKVRVERLLAKKSGAAQAMPLTGKAALAAIAKAAVDDGHPVTKVPPRAAGKARDAAKPAKQASAAAAPAKRASEPRKAGAPTVGSVAKAAILAGKDNAAALAAVMAAFPDCSSNLGCMGWYRNDLRKKGQLARPTKAGK